MSSAERQARFLARLAAPQSTTKVRYRKPADRRTRPQRWTDAVDTLVDLQAEYRLWLDSLPDSLRDSAVAESLQAIVDIDLSDLEVITPPKGWGRD